MSNVIELDKIPCAHAGCDCSHGRIVRDGARVKFDPSRRLHHGRDHGMIDLDILIERARSLGIVKDSRRET
jgi:hypothetical protein